jgi:hypothetical protein
VIWPGTYVSESTLAVVVNGVRHALGDDARQPRFIRTVHGFGYAFCGEARAPADGHSAKGETLPVTRATWRQRWAVAAALGVLLAGWYSFRVHGTRTEESGLPPAVPLTSLPGVELDPVLSPDGMRVAFIWDGPDRNNFDVYVKDIASERWSA